MTKFIMHIQPEMLKKLKREAKALGISMSALVRNLITDYFKNKK